MGDNEKAILRTLLYSDIFDFPLTKSEIVYYLSTDKEVNEVDVERSLKILNQSINSKNSYFFLNNRVGIVSKRIKRANISKEKLRIAQDIASKLSRIPTVLFIGLSGSVAVGNAHEDDDIDFFIITQKHTLFITRLLLLLTLEMLRKRRRSKDVISPNNVCLNMLLSEDSLTISDQRRDIYTARELMQMLPLVEREKTYTKLLRNNSWIEKYLANSTGRTVLQQKQSTRLLGRLLSPFERIVRAAQVRKISTKQTTEEVSDHILAFHPNDVRLKILDHFRKRLKEAKLL